MAMAKGEPVRPAGTGIANILTPGVSMPRE
jgi:hypothetical protein